MTAAETIDFRAYPKQFLISPTGDQPPPVRAAKSIECRGWRLQAAESLPVIGLTDDRGARIGLLVGWAILGGRLIADGETLTLAPGMSVEANILPDLAGRALCLWRSRDGTDCIQPDSAGFLPAVYAPGSALVASTSTLIAKSMRCCVDSDVAAIYAFPKRRGYLPFGLTHHQGVRRLLPGHRLDLDRFRARRVWPTPEACAAPCVGEGEALALLRAVADRVSVQAGAVAEATNPPRLYLSGGHDSRMILAALHAHAGRLICETLSDDGRVAGAGDALDLHIARRVARIAGVRHLVLDTAPASRGEVAAWLERTGWTYYEPLTELAATAKRHDRGSLVMDGTGAEILRAINWQRADLDAPRLTRDVLLARARVPAVPLICAAAERWLEELPPCDTLRALDIAKIDLMHGCWFGPAVYGHDIPVPSLGPFPSQRNHDAALALPKDWKMGGETYRAWFAYLWPELAGIPANRASGLSMLRFPKSEIKRRVPTKVKRWLKPHR